MPCRRKFTCWTSNNDGGQFHLLLVFFFLKKIHVRHRRRSNPQINGFLRFSLNTGFFNGKQIPASIQMINIGKQRWEYKSRTSRWRRDAFTFHYINIVYRFVSINLLSWWRKRRKNGLKCRDVTEQFVK